MEETHTSDTAATCTHEKMAEKSIDNLPVISGKNIFILSPMKAKNLKEIIWRTVTENIQGVQEVSSVEECDFILALCIMTSRAGTDIDAAVDELNALSDTKPAVFMVLHQTFEPDKIVSDSSKYVTRKNTLTVDCLFNEDKGLLNCEGNFKALAKIQQRLPQQETQAEPLNPIDHVSSSESELSLVLLGMSKSEKTAVGNMILARKDSPADTQNKGTIDIGVVDEGRVAVIDTPDWLNSSLPMEEIQQNIKYYISLVSSKPYALLLVIPVEQLITIQTEMENKIAMIYEESWRERLMIVVTITDEQQRVKTQSTEFKAFADKYASLYHVLNISQAEKNDQISELLRLVEDLVAGNINKACESTQSHMPKARNYVKKRQQGYPNIIWVCKDTMEDGFVVL